jgi:PAS domain S-box-containing protein
LNDAARLIAGATTVEDLLRVVTEAAMSLVGTHQAVTSRLVEGWGGASTYVALSDKYADFRAYDVIREGLGVLNAVTRELRQHPEFRSLTDAPGHPPLPDYLGAPLISRDGRNIGLIQLSDKVDGQSFTENDEALVVQLAQMVSAAIEHVELAASLEHALSRLNMALDATNSGTWEWDLASQTITWSTSLERIYGFGPGEFAGTMESYRSRIHPEDRDDQAERVQRALATGERFEYTHRVVRPDGTMRWIEGAGTPVTDLDGQIVGMTGMTVDITDRRLAEDETNRRRRVVETLHRVGQAITSRLQLDEIVQLVTDEATELTPAEFGAFFYNHVDASGESFLLYTISGVPRERFENFPQPRATAIFAPTFNGEPTVLIDDVTTDPRFGRNDPYHGMPPGHLPVRSYLATPVVLSSGEVAGGLFFGHSQPGRFTETDAELVEGIASYAAIAIDNARLYQESHRVATVLQESLLPPTLPTIDGATISACYDPGSTNVGGDFYDVFPLPNDEWGLVIGDMCGQGPEAASRTSLARHTLRAAAILEDDPHRVLTLLNQALLDRDEPDRFCSAVYGKLCHLQDGVRVELVGAGHPAALVRRLDGTVEQLPSGGMVLGIVDEPIFERCAVTLHEGDTIVLYTDGVIEARSVDGELFGESRLEAVVSQHEPQQLARAIEEAVLEFRDSDRADDLAVLVLTASARKTRRPWLPGFDLVRPDDERLTVSARIGVNDWIVGAGDAALEGVAQVRLAAEEEWSDLDDVLMRVAGTLHGPCTLVRVRHDSCGAWCTIVGNGGPRPVTVRRSGWVDVRGHAGTVPMLDRVGLGPGDTLVLWADAQRDRTDDGVAVALLDVTGQDAADVAAAAGGNPIVLRVPAFDPGTGGSRAASLTGQPESAFRDPLFPPGSPEADAWESRPAPPRLAHLRVEPDAAAVGRGRALLRRLLTSWRMTELLDGDIELLASEVLTNGVLHAGTDLDVAITYDGSFVTFAVRDRSHATPAMGAPSAEAEGGRGVWLVESLAANWGVDSLPDGKRVWFQVPA